MSKICNDSYIEYCDHRRMFFNALKKVLPLALSRWMDGCSISGCVKDKILVKMDGICSRGPGHPFTRL